MRKIAAFKVWVEVEAVDAAGDTIKGWVSLPGFSNTGPDFKTEAEALDFATDLHQFGERHAQKGR